ncbi:LysM peptidoglycan-binding domain-containing protein [Diplocloster agilis]|nr:LysM domain-containing protein [Diplocloster agilis]
MKKVLWKGVDGMCKTDVPFDVGNWSNGITCDGEMYVVKEGDTLYRISRQFGVNLASLMAANPYVNVYNLQEGDEICIPIFSNFY